MKSDKELAVEFTVTLLESWKPPAGVSPIKADAAINLLKNVHEVLRALPENQKNC